MINEVFFKKKLIVRFWFCARESFINLSEKDKENSILIKEVKISI